MTLETAVAFGLAMFVLAASPGPGVFATVSQALAGGFRSSLPVISGIVAGDLIFLLAAVLGMSALARALGDMFFVVRMAGAIYLILMGLRMWTPQKEGAPSPLLRAPGHRFAGGLLITMGNPKAILFYAGFLPSFFDLARMTIVDSLLLAATVATVLTTVMAAYALSADRTRHLFRSRRALQNLNRGAGTIMIGAGVAIAAR